MTDTPAITYLLDEDTTPVLIDALEQYAAHLELLTHHQQFAPTAHARMNLLVEVMHAEELRRKVEAAEDTGQITLTLDPDTYRVLTEALAGYHDDQMQAAAEATAPHDDPDEGDPARQAAATADRLHIEAIAAFQCTPRHHD